jgi:hypothetical protein
MNNGPHYEYRRRLNVSMIPLKDKPEVPKTKAELIERWENVRRVLTSLSPHDAAEHFDMADWGRKTECGTVGCAAGLCSLDPWFQERKFKAEMSPFGQLVPSAGVGYHFGDMVWDFFVPYQTGDLARLARLACDETLYNGTRRPVGQVIDEIDYFLKQFREFSEEE